MFPNIPPLAGAGTFPKKLVAGAGVLPNDPVAGTVPNPNEVLAGAGASDAGAPPSTKLTVVELFVAVLPNKPNVDAGATPNEGVPAGAEPSRALVVVVEAVVAVLPNKPVPPKEEVAGAAGALSSFVGPAVVVLPNKLDPGAVPPNMFVDVVALPTIVVFDSREPFVGGMPKWFPNVGALLSDDAVPKTKVGFLEVASSWSGFRFLLLFGSSCVVVDVV
jgi:hypothetical protein